MLIKDSCDLAPTSLVFSDDVGNCDKTAHPDILEI